MRHISILNIEIRGENLKSHLKHKKMDYLSYFTYENTEV
jgi:hypothetical protein